MDCSQTHEYAPSNCNMMFIYLPEAQYVQHTNETYPTQVIDPGDIPNYMGVQQCHHDEFEYHQPILSLLQPVFIEEYKLIRTGNCRQTFQAAFQWFLDKYADLSKVDRSSNKEEMTKQWNPADGFKTLVVQLMKGLIFAQYAGAPISDIDVIDMGINNILNTGLFANEYKKWNRRTGQQKSFPAFKIFWAEQIYLMK